MAKAEIVKTNHWRCVEHCPNCPFLDNGKMMQLCEGRVDGIKEDLLKSDSHSFNCHKTVYHLDNKMQASKKQGLRMCYGAYQFLIAVGRPNIAMRLEWAMDGK